MKNIIEIYQERMEVKEALKDIEMKSIHQRINETRECAKYSMTMVKYIEFSDEFTEEIRKCVGVVKEFRKTLPRIKNVFLKDKKYKNGFVKKSVVNAFKSSKYRKNLNVFLTEVRQNKANSHSGLMDYVDYHDLSANSVEVSRTLNVIEEGLIALERALKKNYIFDIPELFLNLSILINRIRKLYELYRIYLEDIDKLAGYNSISNALEDINDVIEYLVIVHWHFENSLDADEEDYINR